MSVTVSRYAGWPALWDLGDPGWGDPRFPHSAVLFCSHRHSIEWCCFSRVLAWLSLYNLPCQHLRWYNAITSESLLTILDWSHPSRGRFFLVFFFLEYGRCRSEARSLCEHKQLKVKMHKDTFGPVMQANQSNKNTTPNHHKDDPQIPQPDLRFVKKTAKLFFRPSPLRLSPGRHTVFVLMNELVKCMKQRPSLGSQKRSADHYAVRSLVRPINEKQHKLNKPKHEQNPQRNRHRSKDSSVGADNFAPMN